MDCYRRNRLYESSQCPMENQRFFNLVSQLLEKWLSTSPCWEVRRHLQPSATPQLSHSSSNPGAECWTSLDAQAPSVHPPAWRPRPSRPNHLSVGAVGKPFCRPISPSAPTCRRVRKHGATVINGCLGKNWNYEDE